MVAGFGEDEAAAARKLLSGQHPLLTAMLASAASANSADALAALTAAGELRQVSATDGVAVVEHFSFDDDRRAALAIVLPRIPVGERARVLGEVVALLSFDEGRLAVLAEHGATIRQLPRAERERLLALFAFDQERARAAALLDLS